MRVLAAIFVTCRLSMLHEGLHSQQSDDNNDYNQYDNYDGEGGVDADCSLSYMIEENIEQHKTISRYFIDVFNMLIILQSKMLLA